MKWRGYSILSFVVRNAPDAEIAETLLEKGANPNFKEEDKTSCLYMSIRNNCLGMALLLLMYGADVDENTKQSHQKFARSCKIHQFRCPEVGGDF